MLFVLTSAAACGAPLTTPAPVHLRLAGSTTMSQLAPELATAAEQRLALASFEVTCLGTLYGLESLRSGQADLALASWLPTDLDKGWQATPIARDAIAIVVHPDNPLDGLGLLQVQDLFSGRAATWGALGAAGLGDVEPVVREEGSGTGKAFEVLAMEGQRLSPWAVVAPSSQAVIEYVAGHRAAIGYVSTGLISRQVKALKLEGSLPFPQSAADGGYPLTRELWLVYRAPARGAVKSFVDFCLSSAGQQIVGRRLGRIR